MPIIIKSFGFKHGLPAGDRQRCLIVDLRDLKNPYHDKHLRLYNGEHPDVIAFFEAADGMEERYQEIRAQVVAFDGPVYVGCTGGKHRSVYIANRLSKDLGVPVEHLNYGDK